MCAHISASGKTHTFSAVIAPKLHCLPCLIRYATAVSYFSSSPEDVNGLEPSSITESSVQTSKGTPCQAQAYIKLQCKLHKPSQCCCGLATIDASCYLVRHDIPYVMQCVYDDGKSEHRVCMFENLALWEGQLIYVADGKHCSGASLQVRQLNL